jgi:hypothetical protein
MVAQQVEKNELAKALEDKIPIWARGYGDRLNYIF